jgi:hypothetical protein
MHVVCNLLLLSCVIVTNKKEIIMETHIHPADHPLVSWRSVFAGLFVSFLAYATLVALGLAVGGLSLANVIRANSGENRLAIGSGIWLLCSALISLYFGSYFAGRISNFITSRIGAAQGLVIASLFFIIMSVQAGMTLGLIGSGVGNAVSSIGGLTRDVISEPEVQSTLEGLIADRASLRSDPEAIIRGLAVRLARGDRDSARNYLAYETGLPPEEADQRLASVEGDFKMRLEQAGISTARFLSGLGWSLFTMLLLGVLFSALGGAIGSRANYRHPLREEQQGLEGFRPAFQA